MKSKPLPGSFSPRKQLLLEMLSQGKSAAASALTPGEASKLSFTLVGESLHIHGPRYELTTMARWLKSLVAKKAINPYYP
jgi:hypothetical protein